MSSAHTHTVLLVEQDEATRASLANILSGMDHRVVCAQTSEETIFLAVQRKIDALLIRLEFASAHGGALTKRLRAIERYASIPLIVTASSSEDPMLATVLNAGADDVIQIPANPAIVKARLSGYLRRLDYSRELEEQRSNLNRYVSDRTQTMVDAYSATGVMPEPEERDVTVMFADVRGFTSMSEEMDNNILFSMLSRHLAMQVEAVYRHNGYVDKFGGDGIMAIFDSKDPAADACCCALDIIDATRRGRGHAGAPILPLGIGLHHGRVLIGNIGSKRHLDFSVIGETVNLSARLCGAASAMTVVASDSVVQKVGIDERLDFHNRRSVDVRGLRDAVTVFELRRSTGLHARPVNSGLNRFDYDRRSTWEHA